MQMFKKKHKSINLRGRLYSFDIPKVMGIINLTPDSFYGNSRISQEKELLKRVEKMQSEGVDMIDLGGYSSRPGAEHISVQIELERLLPAMKTLKTYFPEIIVSVDTFRSEIARIAISEGADLINDIGAGLLDNEMYQTIIDLNIPYIIMHMQGNPQTMQQLINYNDVVKEVTQFLGKIKSNLNQKGLKDVIVDPGFGFGKTLEQNYQLLKNLAFLDILDAPILVGLSRKSMINNILHTTPEEALNGTTVLNTLSLLNSADILRVHDVREAIEVIKLVCLYLGTDNKN